MFTYEREKVRRNRELEDSAEEVEAGSKIPGSRRGGIKVQIDGGANLNPT